MLLAPNVVPRSQAEANGDELNLAAAAGDIVMDDAAAEQEPQITETIDLEEFSRQLIFRTNACVERIQQESNNSALPKAAQG